MKNIEVNLYNDRYAYNEILCDKQDLISVIKDKGLKRTEESWWERIY